MRKRKDGVAVIIVLGVLALMMVLGVAFSVTMRVERAGAANYASTVNTRQLVWAGLARAIADINAATPGFYPDWDYIPTNGSAVKLASGKALEYVPGVLRPVARNAASDWVRIRTADGMGGHVAYLVLNVSDMLDANHVGGALREGGTNVTEIVLDDIGISSAGVTAMVSERQNKGRFESLPEFTVRTGLADEALVTYSRYLQDDNLTNAYYIGTTVAEIESRNQSGPGGRGIVNRLRVLRTSRGPEYDPGPNALLMFDYLLDYVDTEIEPRRLDGPNGKAVPLLNEVAITQPRFDLNAAGRFRMVPPRISIETWFPFFKPSANTFKVHWDQTTTLTISTNAPIEQTNSFESAVYPGMGQAAGMTNEFKVHPSTTAPALFDLNVTTNDSAFQLRVTVSNLRVALSTDAALWVDSATNVVLTYNSAVTPFDHGGMPQQQLPMAPATYQVSDPRLNWLPSSWVTNDTATMASANPGQDGQRIHASNSGILYSPLELGNLLMPRRPTPGPVWVPWDTLKVFNEGGWRDPLLETFTINTNALRRGLVNPNTVDPAILATALRDMPHPYVGSPTTLGTAELTAVQDLFYAARTNGTVFSRLTDVLDLDWRAALPTLSDVEREAIAAYSTGLMGVRQNLYLIIVAGSAAEEGMGVRGQQTVRTQARKTAVALVWRDPVANAQGLHDCFVHYFKWLDD